MSIKSYTTDELEAELERRKKVGASKPTPLADMNWSELIALCILHIDDIEREEHNDDTEHYIYEQAMQCVFGKSVWKWINERL